MLTATDLFCERDDRVLFQHLNFSIRAGEVLQVQGANGSGKTTLLRLLAGLNRSFEGEVRLHEKTRAEAGVEFGSNIFYLGHAPAIKKSLTAQENLHWFCASQGRGNDSDISKALKVFNLGGYEDFPVNQMSAGQQRRVSLSRLCLTTARLWILDEPFTALDRNGVKELEAFLASHAQQGGAVILTTHHELAMPCEVNVLNLDERSPEVPDVV